MGSLSVFWELTKEPESRKESPFQVRQGKRLLGRRVNSNLRIEFAPQALTSYAGLEIISRYFRLIGLNGLLRSVFRPSPFSGDYGPVSMVRLILVLLFVGGRLLRHLAFLGHDPLVRRTAQLRQLPSERTLSRWLKQFNVEKVRILNALNTWMVVQQIRRHRLKLLTLDIDGTVVSTGLQAAWAQRGFNPHHRKVPSYYPLLAHIAEIGCILRLKNRPGNVHDGKRAETFIEDVVRQIRKLLGSRMRMQFRFDGAFFQAPVIRMLEKLQCGYAMKVPFWKWLGIKSVIQMRTRWLRVNDEVSCFESRLVIPKWGLRLRAVCYRKKVFHRTPKNYQLDLFSPDDGVYEYSAIATNLSLAPADLWYFMAGHGVQEKTFAELKDGFAFDSVPTNHYGANSAWQILSVMAHNLHRGLQAIAGVPRRPATRKASYRFRFTAIRTTRFEWLNVAGRLLRTAQGPILRLSNVPERERCYDRLQTALPRASGF